MKALLILFLVAFSSAPLFSQLLAPAGPSQSSNCFALKVGVMASTHNDRVYTVTYQNMGTAVAEDAYIIIQMNQPIQIVQATHAFVPLLDQFKFELGTVLPDESGHFDIELNHTGYTDYCVEVQIFPTSPCTVSEYAAISSQTDNGRTPTVAGASTISSANILAMAGGTSVAVGAIFEDNFILNVAPLDDTLLHVPNGSNNSSQSTSGTLVASNNTIIRNDHQGNNVTDLSAEYEVTTYCYKRAIDNQHGTTNSYSSTGNNTPILVDVDNDPFKDKEPVEASLTLGDENTLVEDAIMVQVYPNPMQQFVTIESSVQHNVLTVRLVNSAGQLVRWMEQEMTNQLVLERQALSRGLYFYEVLGDGTAIHQGKLIVD